MSGSEVRQGFFKGFGPDAGGLHSTREERGRIDDVLIAWQRPQLRPYLTHFFAQNAADRQVLLENYEVWIAEIEKAREAAGEQELSRLAKDPTLFPPPHDVDPFRSIALAQTPTYIHEDPSDGLDWSDPRFSSSRPASAFSRYEASAASRDFDDLASTFAVTPIASDDEDAAKTLSDAGGAPGSKELDLALINDLCKYEIVEDEPARTARQTCASTRLTARRLMASRRSTTAALITAPSATLATRTRTTRAPHPLPARRLPPLKGLEFRRLSLHEIEEAQLRDAQARADLRRLRRVGGSAPERSAREEAWAATRAWRATQGLAGGERE